MTARSFVLPTLGDVIITDEEGIALALKKMSNGTGRGQVIPATPYVPVPALVQYDAAPDAVGASGWMELTPPPSLAGAPNFVSALDDGTILIGEAGIGDFWIYDPVTDDYTATASTSGSFVAGAFVSGNGKAYAVGGVSDNETVRYDGASWDARAARPAPHFPTVTCTTDGTYLYSLDGSENFQRYDPGGNSWTTLSMPSTGYSYDPLFCDGTSVWVVTVGATTKYVIGTDTWDDGTVLAPPPTDRAFCACGVIGGFAYIAGGDDDFTFDATDMLYIYDLAGDSWTIGPPMSSALEWAAGTVLDGKLYVFGGTDAFEPTARVYTP